jgi:hypothetical protein
MNNLLDRYCYNAVRLLTRNLLLSAIFCLQWAPHFETDPRPAPFPSPHDISPVGISCKQGEATRIEGIPSWMKASADKFVSTTVNFERKVKIL